MQNAEFEEKRAHTRFAAHIPVEYCQENSDTRVISVTNNISVEGICLVTNKPVPAGGTLEIYLKMSDNGEKICTKGKVVWSVQVKADNYQIGIKLEESKLKPIPLVLRTIKTQIGL